MTIFSARQNAENLIFRKEIPPYSIMTSKSPLSSSFEIRRIMPILDWFVSIRSPALTSLAFAFTWLGYATFIMFFMSVGYWVCGKAMFFRILILITVSAVMNAVAKDIFQSPRPPLTMRLDDLVGASYGIPSGHAQLGVVIWMWLAYEIRKAWAWVAGGIIVVGIMSSRMYLGAHYPVDVLIGALLGAVTLVAFAYVKDRKWKWQVDPGWGIAVVVSISAIVFLVWPGAGVAPAYVPTLEGWLVGAIVGLHLESKVLGFSASSKCWRRILGGIVGALAFFGLQKGINAIGAQWNLASIAWHAARGLIAGFFVTLPIPWLLAKLHLVTVGPSSQTKQ